MGGQVSRNDFEWVYTQNPHVARRKVILGMLTVVYMLTDQSPLWC